jgi:hypothetical protein
MSLSKNDKKSSKSKMGESFVRKPLLRVGGVAITVGRSGNNAIYLPAELEAFAPKMNNVPVYLEHVTMGTLAGKTIKAWWDDSSQSIMYEALIYDEETANKISSGAVKHVSIGYRYKTMQTINGHIPRGLDDGELSLVAVAGIEEANIKILEDYEAAMETRGIESMADVPLRDIIEAARKKKATAVITQDIAALETALRGKIEAENAVKNAEKAAAAAPTEAEQKITIKEFIETEIDRRLAIIQAAKKPKEGGEK